MPGIFKEQFQEDFTSKPDKVTHANKKYLQKIEHLTV